MRITVFTPTYNRAYIIQNLYQSLQRQSFHDFEWLVIDDGSTDGTESLFETWEKEDHFFPIRYFKVSNGGKCRAINRALDLAEGELFFTMDSDDYLTDDALKKIDHWFKQLPPEGNVKGIVANKGFSPTETANYYFVEPFLDKSLLEIYTFKRNGRNVFDGERAFVFYTDFHRKYKYPEFPGENFMTEAVTWNRMAHDGFLMRFYNDIIWVFEYLDDGLTKSGNKVFLRNPRSYGLWLSEKAKYLHEPLHKKLRMQYTFTCDLSPLYDDETIAHAISAPKQRIRAFRKLHNLRQKHREV